MKKILFLLISTLLVIGAGTAADSSNIVQGHYFNESAESDPLIDYFQQPFTNGTNNGASVGVSGFSRNVGDWNDDLAYEFDNSNGDYVSFSNTDWPAGSFTTVIRLKGTDLEEGSKGSKFVWTDTADNNERLIYSRSNDEWLFDLGSSQTRLTVPQPQNEVESYWHTVVASYDSNNCMYLTVFNRSDNAVVGRDSACSASYSWDGTLRFSGVPGAQRRWDGKMDEFRLFDTNLSKQETINWSKYNDFSGNGSSNNDPTLSNPSPSDQQNSVQLSTNLEIDYSDGDGDTGNVSFYWANNDSLIEKVESVSSGSTATTSNLDLDYNTTYTWYAKAVDGNNGSYTTNDFNFTTVLNTTKEWFYDFDNGCPPQDISGNDNDGTCEGGVNTGLSGEVNSAFGFDGADGTYVQSSVDVGVDRNLTIAGWGYLDTTNTGNNQVEFIGSANTTNGRIRVFHEDINGVVFSIAGDDRCDTSKLSINGSEWYFIAGAYNSLGNEASLYIYDSNSSLVKSDSVTGCDMSDQTGKDWVIGDSVQYDNAWDGKIDEPRIYEEYNTQSEIESLISESNITVSNPSPSKAATNVSRDTELSVKVEHSQGSDLNVTFRFANNNSLIEEVNNVPSGSRAETSNLSFDYDENINWKVSVSDNASNTVNKAYSFTVESKYSIAPVSLNTNKTSLHDVSFIDNGDTAVGAATQASQIVTYNTTDKQNPTVLDTYGQDINAGYHDMCSFNEDIVMTQNKDPLTARWLNVSDPSNIQNISTLELTGTNGQESVCFNETLAVQAQSHDESLALIDISDLENPEVEDTLSAGPMDHIRHLDYKNGKVVYSADVNDEHIGLIGISGNTVSGFSMSLLDSTEIEPAVTGNDPHELRFHDDKDILYVADMQENDGNGWGNGSEDNHGAFWTYNYSGDSFSLEDEDNLQQWPNARLDSAHGVKVDEERDIMIISAQAGQDACGDSNCGVNLVNISDADNPYIMASSGEGPEIQISQTTDLYQNYIAISNHANNGESGGLGIAKYTPMIQAANETDTTPPSITIHSPLAQTYATSSVDLNVTSDDNVSSWEYSLDGAANQTFTPNTTLTGLSEGGHDLTVYATDSNGNTGSSSVSFSVDTDSDPSVSLSLNASTIKENESVEASVSASDDFQVDTVSLDWTDDGTFEETSNSASLTAVREFQNEGSYTVTARATDNASQTSTTSTNLEVDPVITSTNKSIIPTCSNASSEDTFCTTNSTNKVEFGQGFTTHDNSTFSLEVKPRVTSGEYEFFGFANSSGTNNELSESNVFNVSVSESGDTSNDPPFADFSISPSDPVAGESITFDASSSSDSDGSISQYEWDWTDDGAFEDTGETTSHTYSSSGDYNVKLRVTDDDGATSTVTKTLTVGSDTSDGGGGTGGDGGDENTTTGGTVNLGNSEAELLEPHLGSRYGESVISIKEGNSVTVILNNEEVEINTTNVYNTSTADVKVGSESGTYKEGETVDDRFGGDVLYLADVVESPQKKYATFTVKYAYAPALDATGKFAYNYSVDADVGVAVQTRKTGFGNNWQNISKKTYSSSSSGINDSITSDFNESIFEARLMLFNSTDAEYTQPIGFYTGQVPDLRIERPNKGEVIDRKPNPKVELPISFTAFTYNETKLDAYYVDSDTGELFNQVRINEREFENNIYEKWFIPRPGDNAVYTRSFIEILYGAADAVFDLPAQREISVSLDVDNIPGKQNDEFTAYVNASSNFSNDFSDVTSIGRNMKLNIIGVTDESYVDDQKSGIKNETDRTVSSSPVETSNVSENVTDENGSVVGTFEDPYYWLKLPSSNSSFTPEYALSDFSSGTIDFYFDMGHKGNLTGNRTLVIEDGEGSEARISLVPTKTSYQVSVNGSQLESGSWSSGNYTWHLEFENKSNYFYSTENRTDGEMKFSVKKPSFNELFSRWFNPVVEGLTTVYDFGEERAGFLISLVFIGGWFAGFKINGFEYLSRWGAAAWFLFFSWYGFIPGTVQALVVGLVALIFTLKIWQGDSSL